MVNVTIVFDAGEFMMYIDSELQGFISYGMFGLLFTKLNNVTIEGNDIKTVSGQFDENEVNLVRYINR